MLTSKKAWFFSFLWIVTIERLIALPILVLLTLVVAMLPRHRRKWAAPVAWGCFLVGTTMVEISPSRYLIRCCRIVPVVGYSREMWAKAQRDEVYIWPCHFGIPPSWAILWPSYSPEEDKHQQLYRELADHGDANAQEHLGVRYEYGVGVRPDDEQAYKWMSLAAARLTGAQRERAQKELEEIGTGMTPAQIAAAQQLAREWQPVPLSGEFSLDDFAQDLAKRPPSKPPTQRFCD